MIIALTVLFFIIALLLTTMILIQPGSSGGLGFIGGGSQSAFGTKTGNVMTKITTTLAALFLLVSLVLGYLNSRSGKIGTEELIELNKTVEQLPEMTETEEGSYREDIGVDISDTNK